MHDSEQRRLYVAIGEPGLVSVFDSRRLEHVETIETEPGAHTCCWDPVGRRLYVFCRERRRRALRGLGLSPDARRIVAAQGARALAYGLGSVLVGVTLAERGYSDAAVGAILAAILAGNALVSLLLARYGDRVGRRRSYRALLVAMAVAGTVFALTGWLPALVAAA